MLQPLGDRVLIEPITESNETDSGIVIVHRFKDVEQTGTVRALGQGRFTKQGAPLPHVCEVGDVVVFSPRAGQEICVDGQTYIMLREDEILGKVEA